ncbi:transposase family protein [Nocardia sp. NBC_00881]|uniref:transposase family protein n=1 Tax=Nocardia sp. NBC_00881 TaxID=2975995 RepID=UPI0038633952
MHRAVILAIELSATLTGARSSTATSEWADDAPISVLARLGVTGTVPSESTIRRRLGWLAADGLEEVIGAWMLLRTSTSDGRRIIAFDGKNSQRSPRHRSEPGASSGGMVMLPTARRVADRLPGRGPRCVSEASTLSLPAGSEPAG